MTATIQPTPALPAHAAEAAAAAGGIDTTVLEQAVTIALTGGADEITPGWQQWASCRPEATADYFPSARSPRSLLDRCRESCAVQAECLSVALATGEHQGTWGGTDAAGRKRLRVQLREAGLLGVVGEEAYIAWQAPGAEREPAPPRPTTHIDRAWPHQDQAVEAIVNEIRDGGTCQVAMATASGKTHVAIWSAAQLHPDRVLVLVPSLALVAQTAQVWRNDPRWAATPMLAVCSDTGATTLEATTDPFVVAEFLAEPGIVFATYQSSQVLVDAGVHFDLTIADEAHHLAGDPDKVFAAIVRGEIPTARTLYMTATPKQFGRRRNQEDLALVSMDDGGQFGPRVFELKLSDAVDAGVVADYRVIVAAVDRTVFDRVASHPDLADTDPHLLAGAIAVVEAMGNLHLTSCVSFHTRVERARTFARLVGAVADLFPDLCPAGPGWAGFVHGQASIRIRDRLLNRLADAQTWGVLANAKALGEGVDLPELDAVAIVDPKNSETDVLQATGRALRRPAGTRKVGTVLLPVLLEAGLVDGDPMSGIDERSMDLVAGVLRSLRSHDNDLGTRLDTTRRDLGTRTMRRGEVDGLGAKLRARAARSLLQSRVELNLPGGPTGELAGAMALHLVRETTASWDEAYARLQAYAAEHGHCRIAQSEDIKVVAGASSTLGQWASRQRTLHRRGLLAEDRVEMLQALPGWMWNARDEAWWERFDRLAAFIAEHGRMPSTHRGDNIDGDNIGSFVNTCRTSFKHGGWLMKFPDRIAALEALPGFVWNERDADWEVHFADLAAWVDQHGHASPGDEDVTADGFSLGKWVRKQRVAIREGRRTDDQIARLRALPGWIESFHDVADALWEDGFARLTAHIEAHDALPTQGFKQADGYSLGGWVSKVRQAYRGQRGAGALTAERQARLEALPHWTWTPRVGPAPNQQKAPCPACGHLVAPTGVGAHRRSCPGQQAQAS